MKKRTFLLTLLLFSLPTPLSARPVSVTLYPQGAMVTEEDTFLAGKDIVLTLPAEGDAGSLSVTLSAGSVLESRLSAKNAPSPAMEALQKELDKVRNGLSRVAAERESLSFERLFWADPPMEAKNRKDLEQQAALSTEHLHRLAGKDIALSAEERELERQRLALEARMEAVGNHNSTVQTCTLTLRDAPSGPLTMRWTYFLPGASWQPRYRVLAEEETGMVRVFMDAVLRQSGGMDWNDVDVTLASVEDMHSVNPPALPDWVIGEERPALRAMNVMAAKAPASERSARVQEHATGLRWSLGRMSIPAEGQLTRPVAFHEFSASFCRLVRPLQDTRAWITAFPSSKDLPILPSGQAVFYVNGTENARGTFQLNVGQKQIFFGVDQLVGVNANTLPTGERNDGPSAQVWRRSMDISNGHDKQVCVRVETAAPILRNSSMSLKEKSSPSAELEEKGARYVWLLDIPAGESEQILHDVTVTIPEEKHTDQQQSY